MDTLPNELILIIFNQINGLQDKKKFLRTCNTYNNLTKKIMENVKYSVFNVYCRKADCKCCDWLRGYLVYNLIGICDTMEACRNCINECMLRHKIKYEKYNLKSNNDYCVIMGRTNEKQFYNYLGQGFIIEEILINKFLKPLKN